MQTPLPPKNLRRGPDETADERDDRIRQTIIRLREEAAGLKAVGRRLRTSVSAIARALTRKRS